MPESFEASTEEVKQRSKAGAHWSDLAAAIHMGFAAEDSPHVLHLCEIVDRLAELEGAHAIHLQAHLRQSALCWLAMCCTEPYACLAQYVIRERMNHLLRITLVPHCCPIMKISTIVLAM